MKTLDGYIRVSHVGKRDRDGDGFYTVKDQRKAIEAWAKANGSKIVAWHEDLDQSGGTLNRPGFSAALERARAGLTGGIVSAKLDRLSRSVVGLGTLLEDAQEHGFNVVAVDFGLDFRTSNGRLVANVLMAVAQWERERRGEDWSAARANAIERGVPNGPVPFGYRKGDDGRLVVHKREAAKVLEAFELRASGIGLVELSKRLGWSHSTVRARLADEVYLGVVRSGENRKEDAHEPIVPRELFYTVQAAKRALARSGETTAERLLVGLARCGGCGRTLKVVSGPKLKDGSRGQGYYCRDSAKDRCVCRGGASAAALDAHVVAFFERELATEGSVITAVESGDELVEAEAELAKAEAELEAYAVHVSATELGFRAGFEVRQARLVEARERVAILGTQARALPAFGGASVAEVWRDATTPERRAILAGYLDRVVVHGSATSGPLASRVDVYWSDGTPALIADPEARAGVTAS
jgi:DNA invertase Pin-like site-specific DNA recombinase